MKPGDRVLDVACGGGYVAAAARDQGAEAVGLGLRERVSKFESDGIYVVPAPALVATGQRVV